MLKKSRKKTDNKLKELENKEQVGIIIRRSYCVFPKFHGTSRVF